MKIRTHFRVLLLAVLSLASCVDPYEPDFRATVDVLVVDGTLTNLPEPQVIRLNRSRADLGTGRYGVYAITKAQVSVRVDSAEVVPAHETVDGTYQLPSDFRGQIGHSYQLRVSLSDGTTYVSNPQQLLPVPPITQVYARFNAASLPVAQLQGYTSGHDVYIDTQDPADRHNYYRWDWTLYEPQEWCRTCYKGYYTVFEPLDTVAGFYKSGKNLFEDCFYPPRKPTELDIDFKFDYPCRTRCWEIIHGYTINVFDDQFTNGGVIAGRKVAEIPFHQHSPCLVEVRQSSLTADAYRYLKLVQDQTQNTGGLADTPPTALIGNIHNVANATERVVGYFTVSAVSLKPQYIDRKDTQGIPYGATGPPNPSPLPGEDLFYALNRRRPRPEPQPPFEIRLFIDATRRPPTAVCGPIDQRTPLKPAGWPD